MAFARTLSLLLVSTWLQALVVVSAWAQITNVTDTTSTPIPGVGHDYIKFVDETVNPANGSLSLRIQVPVPPGRKLTIPFAFAYDSNGVRHFVSNGIGGVNWLSNPGLFSQGGWAYSLPLLSVSNSTIVNKVGDQTFTCHYLADYVFQDSAGGRHALGLAYAKESFCKTSNPPAFSSLSYGGDAAYRAFITVDGGCTQPVYITDTDGTVYYFPAEGPCSLQSTAGTIPLFGLPTSVEDRNGNTSVITENAGGTVTVSDTVGRAALSISGFGKTGDTVAVSGLPASYTLTWGSTSSTWAPSSKIVWNTGNCFGPGSVSGPLPVLTDITLPNQQKYHFSYDANGLLNRVTYPTGAYVSYVWDRNQLSEGAHFKTPAPNGTPGDCGFIYDTYAIVHREVSFDGVNVALQQDFKYQTNFPASSPYPASLVNWTGKQTTVVTRDCAQTNYVGCSTSPDALVATTVYTYGPYLVALQPNDPSVDTTQIPVEQTIIYQDGSGKTLETVTKGWDLTDHIPMLACELHTLDDGSISGTFSRYSALQLTDKKEFDYGQISPTYVCGANPAAPAGTPARETVIQYQPFAPNPAFPSGDAFGAIIDRPCSVVMYGNGTRAAETDYLYDGGKTLCQASTPAQPVAAGVAGLIPATRDETHYGPASGYPRGNATSVTKQCFYFYGPTPTYTACPNSTTTYSYDETGQVTSMTDPCGNANCAPMVAGSHTYQYSYSDNYDVAPAAGNTNAYLTGVTNPLGQTLSYQYAYADGQLIASTDANNQKTSYFYEDKKTHITDPLRRLKEIDYPDGGSTTNDYDDTPMAVAVTTTRKMSDAQSQQTVVALDGLGHVVKRTDLNDPDCPSSGDTTDTTYDGFGRVYQVSNPYCTKADTTYGLTTYTYDALGRTVSVTASDGSKTTSDYFGISVTVKDPAGKSRKSGFDTFGRTTWVFEDPSGTDPQTANLFTAYAYDALDNLISVTQYGNNSSNPARSRSFVHDSLSQLRSATNPENGTVYYSYDPNGNAFSRAAPAPNQTNPANLLFTTYTFDVLNRLTAKAYSDTTPSVQFIYDNALANGIGNLTSGIVSSGPNTLSWNAFDIFDAMGRPTRQFECVENCSTSGWVMSYLYDLAGNTTSYSNGLGTTFTSYFSPVNRLTQIQSSLNDATHPLNLFSSARYNASGGLINVGMGIGVVDTAVFNNRLQPSQTTVNSSASGTMLQMTYGFGSAPTNNGNLMSLTSVGKQAFNRTYTYDALNRLTTMSSSGTPTCKWAYDPWGNRTDQTPTVAGACAAFNEPVDPNNRLSGFGYDAAGNMTSDGKHTYFYDGENRLTQVDGTLGNCSTATACYQYGADGRRVQKTVGSAQTVYLYDADGSVVNEVDGSGAPLVNYIYANGALFAEYKNGQTYFIHHDHLGSTRLVTDVNGGYADLLDYTPFGEQSSGDTVTTHKFTGKERDAETGLDFFGARYFSGAQGRFTSVDPAFESGILELPQTWNRYSYVYNRPTFATDPDGRCPICVGALVGGVAEGAWNLGSQFVQHGYSFSGTDWGQVGANFVGGAVAGGLAVATGGTSLFSNAVAGDLVAGTVSNVAGGIVTRAAEGQGADEVFSRGDIVKDAVAGFAGGVATHVAAESVHVPDEPKMRRSRNNNVGRRARAKYAQEVDARNSALRVQAGRGVAAITPTTHGVTGFINNFWDTLDWLLSPPARFGVDSEFRPCTQEQTNCGQ